MYHCQAACMGRCPEYLMWMSLLHFTAQMLPGYWTSPTFFSLYFRISVFAILSFSPRAMACASVFYFNIYCQAAPRLTSLYFHSNIIPKWRIQTNMTTFFFYGKGHLFLNFYCKIIFRMDWSMKIYFLRYKLELVFKNAYNPNTPTIKRNYPNWIKKGFNFMPILRCTLKVQAFLVCSHTRHAVLSIMQLLSSISLSVEVGKQIAQRW